MLSAFTLWGWGLAGTLDRVVRENNLARNLPVLDDWSEGFDAAGDRFGRRRRKLRDWFRGTGR